MKRILFIVAVCSSLMISAQEESKVLDGVFIKETSPTRRVIPYTHVREADVTFYKRVWRKIDLRQKMNHPLYYPTDPIKEIGNERVSLFEIIKRGITEGTLTVFEDDEGMGSLQVPFSKSQAIAQLSAEITEESIDLDTGEPIYTTIPVAVESRNVVEYRIKEDWFFDRERSVMEVRIIAMQPVFQIQSETGLKLVSPFWVYFPEARYLYANFEVYNSSNDGARMTFEDLFRKRMFTGYIYKETNVYDNRNVLEYQTSGIDRLLEAEKIQAEIVNFEHDMWQY